MHVEGGELFLSATDIANHLACRHLTQLDRAVAERRIAAPSWMDPSVELLRQRGAIHERAYVEHLKKSGVEVVELPADAVATSLERTRNAMAAGAGAIVQAQLGEGRWVGRADLLLRVPRPSNLGDWSYEVADTKLAQETRAGTVLQLCLYSELVGYLQGLPPEHMHVIKPGQDFVRESFRFSDYSAYCRLVKRRLEQTVAAAPAATYPYPVAHCDVCRWWKECDARRHADDHLCLVAGIRPLHIAELEQQGIGTLEKLAREPAPFRRKPARGSDEAFARVHGQARIQLAGREAGRILHELLPIEPGKGLALLPAPDPGDIWFDIESDPFALETGLEYLLGVAFVAPDGVLSYRPLWAFTMAEEKKALEEIMDFVMDRWRGHPGMHIYHFSPYEPGAVKRMIGRHGIREEELDRLLRAEKFVDLLAVTRQGMRVSVESYSLKSLEPAFAFHRSLELRAAGQALRRIARVLELAPGTADLEIFASDRDAVESYNCDDCRATAALQAWLEERREEWAAKGRRVPRPEEKTGEASEAVAEQAGEVKAAFEELTGALPDDREEWGEEHRGQWLLAHQLEYFRREDKCAWWEFFRIHGLDHEELMEERKAISGLRFLQAVGGSARSPVHRYAFPAQEAAFGDGDELYEIGGGVIGKVSALDLADGTIDIERRPSTADRHPFAVMVNERVPPRPVDKALLELGVSSARRGVNGNGPYRAARDLLLKRKPRLRTPAQGALRRSGENLVDAAIRLARDLDNGVLPVQGPPGTGKTYTGARMIVALATAGKRIGVTAVSHKVIRHFLEQVVRAAPAGAPVAAIHKVSKRGVEKTPGVEETDKNEKAAAGLGQGKVVGGTCWFWARDDMIESVDYLFIDEAGQMSLAFALAAARSARNLVLLGDPQQLEQPQRGAHPEGAEVAALVHVLEGRKTLADEAGLFLDETWRLHPRICAFTSELFYEGRLRSRAGLERQAINGDTPFAGSGLFYVPVDHEGNQNSSPEEVAAIAAIAESLLSPDVTWTDSHGTARRLHASDILVVAPYNAQVAALSARLPALRVGTVDKFQGQEAPVVIYSMASSSAIDAPRGMGFLFNPNRLNVATSRAQCVCILVAARRLLEPECSTPEQMRWANGLCRYREMAKEIATPGPC